LSLAVGCRSIALFQTFPEEMIRRIAERAPISSPDDLLKARREIEKSHHSFSVSLRALEPAWRI
jgi:hypothetical protein